ncbi:phosphate ABC transporter permease subunit PstC [Halothermothrix orenii]|uniref:Phosphate transport system permease protein n=1 Tax=Halothermothrix orenii (strain H 168 / OCM 544 / DSM 9562) TaxID=373903 RepID=B8D0G6_HALOH|nr:phosphate ABC transporter permease subunit PstC [Halothermothrix orenii]ACL70902.1 phosphate ABC transporter, inner membrane subunit PstC [Halothermothrix orenii H 168]
MRRWKEKLIELFFMLNGLVVIIALVSIFYLLIKNSWPAIQELGLKSFFSSARWNPTSYNEPGYGILGQILSTLMVTLGSMVISVPLGVATAAYISEVASPRARSILKPVIEILAGIPSVVIGFLGIVLLGPVIASTFGLSNGLNALNGAILLAIMSLPTIISLSEDAISSVPDKFKRASLGLGANDWQTLTRVTIPSSLSGVIAAIMLGMGRAIGETMTVLMATGNAPALPGGFFDSVRTMTATIAIELGEVPYNSTHYYALFMVGLVLFIMTFIVNLVSDIILNKYQEVE